MLVLVDGFIRYANPAAVKLYRAGSDKDLVGRSMRDLIHPDWYERVLNLRDQVTSTGITGPLIEMRYNALDGTIVKRRRKGPGSHSTGPWNQISARDIGARKVAELRAPAV